MRLAVVVFGLLLSVAVWADPDARSAPGLAPRADRIAELLSRGANRLVIQSSRQVLKANPSATGIRAVLGIALAREGAYSAALPQLEEGAGMPSYGRFNGIAAHADALRIHGRGQQAWALRSTRLALVDDPRAEVKVLVHGVDDLLAAEDIAGAIGLAWRAVGIAPEAAVPHAALALAHALAGDWERADYHGWLARSYSRTLPRRLLVVEAWLAERAGHTVVARQSWERIRIGGMANGQTVAWHAGWHRRQGRLEQAERLVNDSRWKSAEHAAVLAERATIHAAQKRHALARRAWARLALLFPGHPLLWSLDRAGTGAR